MPQTPTRIMRWSGGPLKEPANLLFEEKYGVWFCMQADQSIRDLLPWDANNGPLARAYPYHFAAARHLKIKAEWL